jgi:hypothetical protein
VLPAIEWKNLWVAPPSVSRTLRAWRSVFVSPGWAIRLAAFTPRSENRRWRPIPKWKFASFDCP